MKLLAEYGRMITQIEHMTKISDKMSMSLNKYKNQLLEKVNVDELSGIYNRRYLMENLPTYISDSSRSRRSLSVLMIDIDYFKKYNDIYGHLAGDKAIKMVAQTIRSVAVRTGDIVARYGGEEFCVILSNTNKAGAKKVAERILAAIAMCKRPHKGSDVSEYLTLSIGVTTSVAKKSSRPEDYLQSSDDALYLAKTSGRNKYVVDNISPKNKEVV